MNLNQEQEVAGMTRDDLLKEREKLLAKLAGRNHTIRRLRGSAPQRIHISDVDVTTFTPPRDGYDALVKIRYMALGYQHGELIHVGEAAVEITIEPDGKWPTDLVAHGNIFAVSARSNQIHCAWRALVLADSVTAAIRTASTLEATALASGKAPEDSPPAANSWTRTVMLR